MHAISHETVLVDKANLPHDFLEKLSDDITIRADITEHKWKQAIFAAKPELWTGSFPCQSWSGAAWAKGLNDPNGHTFLEGMMQARIARPKHMLLENVAGLMKHKQYNQVKQIIHFAGYRILHEGIIDIRDRTPVRRPRWICFLERVEEPHTHVKWTSWTDTNGSTPLNWDVLQPSTDRQLAKHALSPEVLAKYLDPQLLPSSATAAERDNPRFFRLPSLNAKLPTFMSLYTRQHELPEQLLQDKGLMGHCVQERDVVRWFKPAEIAFMHCTPAGTIGHAFPN